MPRRGGVKKRQIIADPVYKSTVVTALINRSMRDGKKSAARKQVYNALEEVEKKSEKPAIQVLAQALDNIMPDMEVRPRRVGGAAYQVPVPVKGDRKQTLGIRWLIFAARARDNSTHKTYGKKLAAEVMDAAKGEGGAVKKRDDVEKMAEANRAFAHFRW